MIVLFGLKESVIQKIHAVFANHPPVEKAVLYGSRAKGNFRNGSDIDLTLIGGNTLTLEVLYRILSQIDDLCLPYTFDLSIFRQISDPDLIDHIQRVGVVFYEREVETSRAAPITFQAIIERSRASYAEKGGLSSAEMRRRVVAGTSTVTMP